MPLPVSTASTPWPPPDIAPYVRDQAAWQAWWSGDLTKHRRPELTHSP